MSEADGKLNRHFVCTPAEARRLVEEHSRFWVGRCGCREGQAKKGTPCRRSRPDVCLQFALGVVDTEREVPKAEAEALLREAVKKGLVARPFRDLKQPGKIDGICLCCDCCCGYFLDPEEACDKGAFAETTDLDACTQCGDCAPACFFGARTMSDGELREDREKCYGCGLCAEVCPPECVEMVGRS